MKALRRVTLLGCFAAVGAGLAICLGTAATPPDAPADAPADAQPTAWAVRVVTENDTPAEVPEAIGEDAPVATPEGPALPDRDRPFLVAPDVPLCPEPHPAYAQQIAPMPGGDRLERVLELLQSQLGGQAGGALPAMPGGAGLPLTPPAPPGEAPRTTDDRSRADAPPDATTFGVGGAAPQSAAGARGSVTGSGDGRLAIHFPDNDIREVLEMLSEHGNLNILAGKSVQGRVSASLSGVDIDSALSAILKSTGYIARREDNFIFVGTPEEFTSMDRSLDAITTRVYRPNYVAAAELQKLIQPLLSERVGIVSVSTPAEAGISSDANTAGGDSYAGTDVVLVRDYEAVLIQIDQLVREVDVRPMQVHIEAMILSVKLKDSDSYGVNFQLLRDNPNIRLGLGNPPSTLANFKFEDGALKFGFLDSSLGAFLSALETVGETNIVATPRLMVINKHRAEIQIGESKGYVSTTVTETASTQAVEFLEVGALLRLRPYISSDGLIRMEVHPELSDGSVKIEQGFTLPEKEVTQVTTNIMVRDGCTVVIGGLMRENLVTTRNQIPYFGNLPLVGFAFRSTNETTERREVLVLITPRIVYEPGTCAEGDKVAGEAHRRQSVYFDKMTPLNKRSVARRYFRLAQSAWSVGERDKALRWAEMAVHFDPLNRAAIDLRSDIWLGRRLGDHTLEAELPGLSPGLPPDGALDGERLPDWLLDDLLPPAGPTLSGTPLHPFDPGQPGRVGDLEPPTRQP